MSSSFIQRIQVDAGRRQPLLRRLENKRFEQFRVAQRDGFAGEFRHAALQQHPEALGFLTAGGPVAERLHDAGLGDLLPCPGQSRVLAALLGERVLERLDHLPEIMFDRSGAFGRNERDPLPERRFSDQGIAELGGVPDERFQFVGVFAALDKGQNLRIGIFLLGTLVVGTLLVFVRRHDDPFAVTTMLARLRCR